MQLSFRACVCGMVLRFRQSIKWKDRSWPTLSGISSVRNYNRQMGEMKRLLAKDKASKVIPSF